MQGGRAISRMTFPKGGEQFENNVLPFQYFLQDSAIGVGYILDFILQIFDVFRHRRWRTFTNNQQFLWYKIIKHSPEAVASLQLVGQQQLVLLQQLIVALALYQIQYLNGITLNHVIVTDHDCVFTLALAASSAQFKSRSVADITMSSDEPVKLQDLSLDLHTIVVLKQSHHCLCCPSKVCLAAKKAEVVSKCCQNF